jgi:hypothetical protein
MKKTVLLCIIGSLVISGIGAGATPENGQQIHELEDQISFSPPVVTDHGAYVTIDLNEKTSMLHHPGEPMIPVVSQVYTFPFGTTIHEVTVRWSHAQHRILLKKIQPASHPRSTLHETIQSVQPSANEAVYGQSMLYPVVQSTYTVGSGIQGDEHVLFLTVHLFPVRYNPVESMLQYMDAAEVLVQYEPPVNPIVFPDEYDMVIIAPQRFSNRLEPLVTHKNTVGVATVLKTVETICDEFSGRDEAEQVKYFIKDALENWGITHVLLVGGRHGGLMTENWWTPVRYSHLDDGSNFETSYLSDLYFADIYDAGGNFSSWDSNDDGVFAEWSMFKKDILDMYPDVYVGRLPCRNQFEVDIMVNKIIQYETTTAGQAWFNRMVVVGGDSAPGDEYYEGEEENKQALEWMPGFDGVKVWTSDGSLSGVSDVVDAITEGCGFLFFDGHGNPSVWSTHPPNDEETWITGLNTFDMPDLDNGEQLPICVVGACHNSQFNVSILNLLKGVLTEGLDFFKLHYYYKEWIPECWSWRMARTIGGGCIAIMGYTGLDWFAIGDYDHDDIPDCIQYYSGYANTHFFKNYGINNITILGNAHTQTLIDYLTDFPPMNQLLDCKTVQEFALIGDPSLQIGGYP